METTRNEYHHNYYETHKEHIKALVKENSKNITRRKIVHKLNNNEYTRLPYGKIQKYNIVFENNKYI